MLPEYITRLYVKLQNIIVIFWLKYFWRYLRINSQANTIFLDRHAGKDSIVNITKTVPKNIGDCRHKLHARVYLPEVLITLRCFWNKISTPILTLELFRYWHTNLKEIQPLFVFCIYFLWLLDVIVKRHI